MTECNFYQYRANPKRHGDISEFFYPIFEWIQFHYPSGGVTFIVDHDEAKMQLEYGVSVFSKRIQDGSCFNTLRSEVDLPKEKKE